MIKFNGDFIMKKDNKSKDSRLDKLRKVLDNNDGKDLHPKDEIFLKSLSKRLEESSYKAPYHNKKKSKDNGDSEEVSLIPKVKIVPREEKKIVEFPDIDKDKPDTEIKETSDVAVLSPDKRIDLRYEDEEVFEIEKVKYPHPEFIEIKPKKDLKEKMEIIFEEKPEPVQELAEWEPVVIKKDKLEKKESDVKVKLCKQCGAKLIEDSNFCEKCGNKITTEPEKQIIKKEPEERAEWKPLKIEKGKIKEESMEDEPIQFQEAKEEEIIKEKVEEVTFEIAPLPIEKITKEEIKKERIFERDITFENEKKIEVFKDIQTVDNETAIKLYDHGYTTKDSLKTATIKDLKKIKGIKRKKAKEIIEELKPIEEFTPITPPQEIPIQKEPIEEPKEIQKIEEKPEGKEPELKAKFCDQCGAKLIEDSNFCEKCGNKITTEPETEKREEETKKIPTFIPLKPKEEKEELEPVKEELTPMPTETTTQEETQEWEPLEIEEPEEEEKIIETKPKEEKISEKVTKPKEDIIEIEEKTKPFEELKSIDQKTAILLYDNGFKNVDSLKEISYKELAKDIGIKKRLAKKIIEEINKPTEEFTPITPETETTTEKETIEEPEEIPPEETISIEEKTKPFEELKSIDQKTAILLYDNGITNIEQLKTATIKDLKKIKGIKRKKAKEIIEELKPQAEEESKEDLQIPEPEKVKEDIIEEKDPAFQEINSIDINISKLLVENGIKSIEDIKNSTIDDLCKIKGIKRKVAKEIKKEVREVINKKVAEIASKNNFKRGENPFIDDDKSGDWEDWEYFDEEKISSKELKALKGFIHGDYTLYEKEISTKSKVKRTIRFFSKAKPENAEPIDLPKGYVVKENKKTGVPYLKKKK